MQANNRRLYRIARGILRNDGEAEDVVQETWVRAFTHLESFRGDSSLATWLARIAASSRPRARRISSASPVPAGMVCEICAGCMMVTRGPLHCTAKALDAAQANRFPPGGNITLPRSP
jgi:hypothetical protein